MGSAVLTSTNATWPWTTTGGQTTITAELLGGGGGGGQVSNNTEGEGGGGKGGAYVRVTVTKGTETTLNITVGTAGTESGGAGGASSLVQDGVTRALAPGGAGGGGGTGNQAYPGGTTENGTVEYTGGTYYAGGNGGDGNITTHYSGGGGGAAGPTSAGTAASGATLGGAGTGTWRNGNTYQAAGAAGKGTGEADGDAGGAYGGGGSGGIARDATNHVGGVGGAGIVVLTWNDVAAPSDTVTSVTDVVTAVTGAFAVGPVSDSVTATDVITAVSGAYAPAAISDTVTASDVIVGTDVQTVVVNPTASVGDDLPTTDAVLATSYSIPIVVTDVITAVSGAYAPDAVSDTVTVTDAVQPEMGAPGGLTQTTSDQIPVTDAIVDVRGVVSPAAISDTVTVTDTASGSTATAGNVEPFETTSGWIVESETSGTGSTVARSSDYAHAGSYSAKCVTTNSGAKAQIYDADFTSSSIPTETPGDYHWQHAWVYVPSATANALTGSEYLDLAAFYATGSSNRGWYLRLNANAALAISGPYSGAQYEFNLYTTFPLDQWVEVEIGLWSLTIEEGASGRSFIVFLNGNAYGWFRGGETGTTYNRVAMGVVATNSTDDLAVYVDDWRLFVTGQDDPVGTDYRRTASPDALDFRDQAGRDLDIQYGTWHDAGTAWLDATHGVGGFRSQVGPNTDLQRANLDDSGWALIELDWVGGTRPNYPPDDIWGTYYFAAMVAFKKDFPSEQNLEIVFLYDYAGSGTTELVYESWGESSNPTVYDTWQIPTATNGGGRIPEPGDKIRVRWERSGSNLQVVADYYDASTNTWTFAALSDTRAMTSSNGVNWLDGTHASVSITTETTKYSVRELRYGTLATLELPTSANDTVTVSDVIVAARLQLAASLSDSVTATDVITAVSGAYAPAAVSDTVTVSDSADPFLQTVGEASASPHDTAVSTDTIVATSRSGRVVVTDAIVAVSGAYAPAAVVDSVTVTDAIVAVSGAYAPAAVSDAVTVTDTASAETSIPGAATASVSDTVTASDVVTEIAGAISLTVSDQITVSDTATGQLSTPGAAEGLAWDDVTVTDVVTAVTGAISLTVSDQVTVTDTATGLPSTPGAAEGLAWDDLTVTDAVAVTGAYAPAAVSDSSTVTDVVTAVTGAISLTVSDTVTLTDTATGLPSTPGVAEALTWDDVTVTDVIVQAKLEPLRMSGTDTVTVTDAVTDVRGVISPAALAETVTLTDTVSVRGTYAPTAVSDAVTVTDVIVQAKLEPLRALVTDTVTATDAISAGTNRYDVTTDDSVTVTDTATGVLLGAVVAEKTWVVPAGATWVVGPTATWQIPALKTWRSEWPSL